MVLKNHVLSGLLLSKSAIERLRHHCVGMSNVPGAPNQILCCRPSHVEAVCPMIGEKIKETLHAKKGLAVGLCYLKIFIPVWDFLSCDLSSTAHNGAFWVGSFSWCGMLSEYLNLALLPLQTVLGKLSGTSYLPFSVLNCEITVTLLLCIASKDTMRICKRSSVIIVFKAGSHMLCEIFVSVKLTPNKVTSDSLPFLQETKQGKSCQTLL